MRKKRGTKRYIIYALSPSGKREVGVAHKFDGKLRWDDRRFPLNEHGQCPQYQKTLDRLVDNSLVTPVIMEDNPHRFSKFKPKHYPGIPYKITVVVEEET